MWNLQVFREERVDLKLNNSVEGDLEVIVARAYDSDHGRLFLASSACTVYTLYLGGLNQSSTSLLDDNVNGSSPDGLQERDTIISMEFLSEKEVLVLGLAPGDILQLDPSTQEVEVVGAIEGGLVSMVLSPDGELLVLATGLGQLLLMTQDWDVLYEVSLNQPPGSSSSAHFCRGDVQISWRGDGKYFSTLEVRRDSSISRKARSTSSIKVWERESGALHSCGEPMNFVEPVLSWSPSGACIATACSRSETGESPVVVLFEKNGLKRDSFEISVPPGTNVLSVQWNANSDLLATVIREKEWDFIQVWSKSNFHWYLKQEWRYSASDDVRMFWDPEKPLHLLCWTTSGCLRKITLCWKSAVVGCSTAFVIDGRNLLITSLSRSIIPPPMAHLKVNFPSTVQTVASIFENTSRCLIAAGLSDGSVSVFILPTVESWDDLEGSELSASRVLSDPILNFGKLRQISWLNSTTLVGAMVNDVKSNSEYSSESDLTSQNTSSIVDSSRECLVELKLLSNIEESLKNMADTTSLSSDKWVLRLVNQTLLHCPIAAIAASPLNVFLDTCKTMKAEAFVQLMDGSVFVYSSDGDVGKRHRNGCNPVISVKFASPSPWMQAVTYSSNGESHVVLIGLDKGGRLQVDGQVVSNDCTSFKIHTSEAGMENKVDHIVFTTKLDTLHVINLKEILAGDFSKEEVKDISSLSLVRKAPTTLVGKSRARMLKGTNTVPDSLRVRSLWERGAQLVTTLGGTDVAVIMQTVRGNLETIFPRALVLGAIAIALNQDNYQDAVLLTRRHHINPNVLVDYKGWREFSEAAQIFVKQVQNLSHVTEVVQALTNENVMETTYKNLMPVYHNVNAVTRSLEYEPSSDKSNLCSLEGSIKAERNKVQEVLRAIRTALQKEVVDSPARELCILTTLACSDPPELEAALLRIKGLREAEVQGVRGGCSSHLMGNLSAEAAVKHLIWLSDPDYVFNAAVGLYDLHLAAMVASNSQKDPKEFLPLLEELGNMPAAQMRYQIDCRLGHYESALRNCADMGSDHFSDCIQLVKANPTLFPSSLQIFKDVERRSLLLDAWGDHLMEQSMFDDAGVTFCACSNFEKALTAYKLGGLWEKVMTVAGRLGKSPTEIVEIATDLRDELQAMGRPKDAANLALDYCGDVEGAISLLIEAHEWLEVARLAYLHGRRELVSSLLEPAVLESANTQLKEFQEGVEKVGKYLARFLAVNQRRVLLETKLKTDERNKEKIDDDASSDISLASSTHSNVSGVSGFSAYTHGTTRTQSTTASTRAKGVRQRVAKSQGGRIKAGSPDEEQALVEHLKSMALGRNSLEEHRSLLQALMQLEHESIARKLQQAMLLFISFQQDSVKQAQLKLLESVDMITRQSVEEPPRSIPTGLGLLEGAADLSWQWEILR